MFSGIKQLQSSLVVFYSKRKGGTGLGLTFCKNLMDSAKGEIICEAEEDKYTRFILKFPKKK